MGEGLDTDFDDPKGGSYTSLGPQSHPGSGQSDLGCGNDVQYIVNE